MTPSFLRFRPWAPKSRKGIEADQKHHERLPSGQNLFSNARAASFKPVKPRASSLRGPVRLKARQIPRDAFVDLVFRFVIQRPEFAGGVHKYHCGHFYYSTESRRLLASKSLQRKYLTARGMRLSPCRCKLDAAPCRARLEPCPPGASPNYRSPLSERSG